MYFRDRGCIRPLRHLSGYATAATYTRPRLYIYTLYRGLSWWRGTVVERRSLAGEHCLSCARPAADG